MKNKATFLLGTVIIFFSTLSLFAQAPIIIKGPSRQGVVEGQTATFFVNAIGDSLNFQWYVNSTPIASSNDSVYTTPPTTLADNGNQFKVIVTNNYGSDTSITVKLFVTAFETRVTENQIVLYDFHEKMGNQINDVSGYANPLDLTINNSSSVDWSNYALYIKSGASIHSSDIFATQRVNDRIVYGDNSNNNEMSLEIWMRPLTSQNCRIINYGTSNTNINFGIENYDPYGYNYLVKTTTTNSEGIPGIVDTLGLSKKLIHLVFTRSLDGVSKIYREGTEVSSKMIGGNLSNWVYLSRLSLGSYYDDSSPFEGIIYLTAIYNRALDSGEVKNNFDYGYKIPGINAPFIIKQPKSAQLILGDSAFFNVNVVSQFPLSYQWQKNGIDIPGAIDSFYSISSVSIADTGSIFRVIVNNGTGKDTSDNAILTIPPVATPTNLSAVQSPTNFRHVKLTWVDKSPKESGTIIERKTGDSTSVDPFLSIGFVLADITIYIDSTVSEGTTYTYRAKAYNADTSSAYSNISSYSTPLFTIAAPTNLVAVLNPTDTHFVKITWNDNSTNELGFIIERKTGDTASVAPFVVLDSLTANTVSLIDSSVVEYKTYTYRLKAFNPLIGSNYSNMASVTTALFSVPEPTNLLAFKSPADSHHVKLTWVDNSPNELGFVVDRKLGDSLSASSFVNIGLVNANITSFEDTLVVDTTTYTYRVYAFKIGVVSNYSNLAQITTPVPVELTSFNADVVEGRALIFWETATEINNAGFSIQRSKDNSKFEDIAFIKGKGTTTTQSSYSYTDKSILSGKYYYRLKQIDLDGSVNITKSIEIDLGLPKVYALEQNYPNPFNPTTTIRFALPISAKVTIKLYNALGQEVANILNTDLDAGIHETVFNSSNLSSGVYFYSLKVQGSNGSNFTSTKRMILMK